MASKSTFLDHTISLDNTDSTQLCDEDIFDMMTALVNLFHKWKEIGTALGLRNYILEIIEAKCRTNVRLALQEVIVEFLRKNYNCDRFGDPSWRSLAKAVAHPVGGADVPIAMEIANAHPAKANDQESLPSKPILQKDSDHIYSVGCPVHLLKYDWYHGELTLEEVTKILISNEEPCFLVRKDKENADTIVLSMKGEGEVAHLTVSRGPGWYAVEGTAKQFETVAELVMYYQTNSLADNSNLFLGVPCLKNNSSSSVDLSNTSEGLYDVGAPSELLKHNWYSGKLTREVAQEKLSATEDSRFLVWVDDSLELFLSLKRPNETSHLNIERGPGWYTIEGTFQLFPSVPDLVHYYNLDLFPAAADAAFFYNLNGNFQSGLVETEHIYDYIDIKSTQPHDHEYDYIRVGEHSKGENKLDLVRGDYVSVSTQTGELYDDDVGLLADDDNVEALYATVIKTRKKSMEETELLSLTSNVSEEDDDESPPPIPPQDLGPRRLLLLRHAERVDVTFGKQWIELSFDSDGFYHRRNLNMPKDLPKRKGGPTDFINDTPITETGIHQAKLTGEAMREQGIRITHLYCSPALRCVQTANAILQGLQDTSLKIKIEIGLFEWLAWCRGGFPTFMTPPDLSKCGLTIDTSYVSQVALQDLKPNETHTEFYKRMFNITRLILKTVGAGSGNIMFVGHAATLEACTRQLVGAQPRPAQELTKIVLKIPYCGLTVCQESEYGKNSTWDFIDTPIPPLTHAPNIRFDWRCLQ